jgi:hypothetical protein
MPAAERDNRAAALRPTRRPQAISSVHWFDAITSMGGRPPSFNRACGEPDAACTMQISLNGAGFLGGRRVNGDVRTMLVCRNSSAECADGIVRQLPRGGARCASPSGSSCVTPDTLLGHHERPLGRREGFDRSGCFAGPRVRAGSRKLFRRCRCNVLKSPASSDLGDAAAVHAKPRGDIVLSISAEQHPLDGCCVAGIQTDAARISSSAHASLPYAALIEVAARTRL